MKEFLFYIVILLANIIQGITGFAGTILAMPFGLMLVGYDVAKPVLNVLGLLSGIYVFAGNRKHVDWKEFKKIVIVMAAGIFAGIGLKALLCGQEGVLYKALGIFVVFLGAQGIWRVALKRAGRENGAEKSIAGKGGTAGNLAILLAAGIAHGLFVSGGPLLIGYLTRKLKDKEAFRATISTVWIFLNTIILVSDICSGLWTADLIKTQVIAIPFLLAGMMIGGKLYRIMSQRVFMMITYVLLAVSGITLLLR